MDIQLLALLLWFPVFALLLLAGYVYMDAPKYDMNPRKWAAIAFFIPFFGFFAYLFERGERTPGPERDMFEEGRVFEIHESRAGEPGIDPGGPRETDEEDDPPKEDR